MEGLRDYPECKDITLVFVESHDYDVWRVKRRRPPALLPEESEKRGIGIGT
jgi:hypothetical protein